MVSDDRKQITIRIPAEMDNDIYMLARKNKRTKTHQLRLLLEQSLSTQIYKNEEETILANMKQAFREVLTPSVERLASINSKNSIASATDMLLTSMLLYRLCDPSSRPKLDSFMEQARILGIKFVQLGKGSIEDYLKSSMEQLNEMWEE